MRTQRNMAQMKEQLKTPGKELNKREISNLSDAEFKILLWVYSLCLWGHMWPRMDMNVAQHKIINLLKTL